MLQAVRPALTGPPPRPGERCRPTRPLTYAELKRRLQRPRIGLIALSTEGRYGFCAEAK